MTEEEFRELLTRPESETLDYKAEAYDLAAGRYAFAKDVLAMANTPRDREAMIVFGVSWKPETGSTVVGLASQRDDVDYQNAFPRSRVQPVPRFCYTPLVFQGHQVGVLTIGVSDDGPYTPVHDAEQLQAGAVYYRRGTQNERAVGSEHRRIASWFLRGDLRTPEESGRGEWQSLYETVHAFDPGATYILAADRVAASSAAPIPSLAMVPWRAVIDFDPDSEASGLLGAIGGPLGRSRVVHRVVIGDSQVTPEPGTHWFFARGLSGRAGTTQLGEHKAWLRTYKQELGRQLSRLASVISPSPVIVVVLWSDLNLRNHLRTLIEECHGAFGEAVEVVVVSPDAPSFEGIALDAGAAFIRMSLRSLCAGVAVHYADLQDSQDERCVLPTSSGAQVEVPTDVLPWLNEDLELVHRGTGLAGEDNPGEYRRGADVSWRNLQLHHDCDRDVTGQLRTLIGGELKRRQTVRVNLYHAPGAGGTTVARRVAWDLHETFPVAILRRCAFRDTAERLAKVATLTESTVLVVVDGGQHSETEIDDLYGFLKAGQTPAVVLQILRRGSAQHAGKRSLWLDARLSEAEADRFRDGYSQVAPAKRAELADLARNTGTQRNAFFFGLTAFGNDFRGLGRYVQTRLVALTAEQKRIVAYIAIAHYFGQQSVPEQAFAGLLGLTRSRTLNLPAAFAGDSKQALELLVRVAAREWRTAHHLIALEIMQQVLAPEGSLEPQSVWRQNLSSWGKAFATFCRGEDQTVGDRLLELVRRVYIYRDNVEVLGTERSGQKKFAHLVEEIPSREGRIEVLRHLTEAFPAEAHFHAHLGRFLGLSGEYEEGVRCIDFAISLQPDDHVLHHMRGMALRNTMRAAAGAGATANDLLDLAKKATTSFEAARERSPDLEHAYISEVQMLVDLLDLAGRGQGKNTVQSVLARPETDPFLKEALDRAEDLMDQVNHLYTGEQPSEYAQDCKARLLRIYGDYATALQAWDSLLARPGVAKPPVRRQIVWTMLHRSDGEWNKLDKRDITRARKLLEENLDEAVNDSTSLRLWLRAIRQSQPPPTLDSVIEKVTYWKANTGSLDAAFYLYVLHMLRALDGSSQGAADAGRALEECRSIARFRRDRTRSFEWIGPGEGVERLVHQSQLGEWIDDFWEGATTLARLAGRVAAIDGPQKGTVELSGGVEAFFVPAKAGLHSGKDENLVVTCYLGFSYEGPRAWGVSAAE